MPKQIFTSDKKLDQYLRLMVLYQLCYGSGAPPGFF